MSKRLNVKVDSCYDCPHNESDGWCNNLLKIVEKDIPDDCPLPDDVVLPEVSRLHPVDLFIDILKQSGVDDKDIDHHELERCRKLLSEKKAYTHGYPVKHDWKTEEEKEAFIKAWRKAMGHEGEE